MADAREMLHDAPKHILGDMAIQYDD